MLKARILAGQSSGDVLFGPKEHKQNPTYSTKPKDLTTFSPSKPRDIAKIASAVLRRDFSAGDMTAYLLLVQQARAARELTSERWKGSGKWFGSGSESLQLCFLWSISVYTCCSTIVVISPIMFC